MNLLELAAKVEAATEADQHALLQEAWKALFPKPRVEDEPEWAGPGTLREPNFHAWLCRRLDFQALAAAGAYLDAALTLAPQGWNWRVDQGRNAGAALFRDGGHEQIFTLSDTPALALTAAALRARATQEDK